MSDKTTRIKAVAFLLMWGCFITRISFSEAAPIFFSDRAAFEAAVTAPLTEEFFEDSFASAESVQFNGFSLSVDADLLVFTTSPSLVSQGAGASSDSTSQNRILTFAFDNSTRAFGVDINDFGDNSTAHSLTATSDTGSFVNHVIATAPPALPDGNTIFFGVIDDSPFDSVTFDTGIGADRIGLDFAVHSPVPEPTTLTLTALGLLAMCGRRRKR